MAWGLRRQIFIIFIFIVLFSGLGFWVLSPYINKAPTCTDGIENGDETGRDCGGSCSLVCTFEVDEISLLWSRSFEVIPGRYNAVAYLENHNKDTIVSKIKYRFRFADRNNIYIGQREGEAFVPPGGKFAIFEPAIGVGNSVPVYTHFDFTEFPIWKRLTADRLNQIKILVSDTNLSDQNTKPILTSTLKNISLFTIPEVNVVAILYDEDGNALATSRTFIDELGKEESKVVSFTWPEEIKGNVVTKEIIPIYDVSQAVLR